MRALGHPRATAVSSVALVVLWLALVGSHDPQELVLGAVAAVVAVVAREVLVGCGLLEPVAKPRVLWTAGRGLLLIPRDTAALAAALLRGQRGTFALVPLPRGRDWRRHGERGVGAAAGTIAPGAYVVDIDAGQRASLVHRLPTRPEEPLL